MGITVVGSVAIDNVITPFGKNFNAPGGSATYFSLSASYFTKVRLIAVVGKDFPKKYITLLKKKSINVDGLEVKKGKTFRWKGRYGWDLDNAETLATHLNLFKDFKPVLSDQQKRENILFLANIDPELQLDVIKQSRSRIIAADTMNFWIGHKKKKLLEVLKNIDMLILNEHEARQLTKEGNLLKAGRAIIRYGTKKVIIKKGEDGVLFVSKRGFFTCPAYLMEDIYDPTGAGDTFAGGFLGYLSKVGRLDDAAIRRALVYGTIMASFTVEAYDIKSLAKLNRAKIERRFKVFKSLCSFLPLY
ncbi:MAG: sugar kinase [Candidatus Omnitrophica bacterium]|nr:sugar kinase [Candidatus Omnitrophota bacterium]